MGIQGDTMGILHDTMGIREPISASIYPELSTTSNRKGPFVKRKRKQRKQEFDNATVWATLENHCPNLMAKFSFVKSTPVEFSIKKLRTMPFKLIDKTWERYGIARVYDATESTKVPILECWYPSNTIRVESPAVLDKVYDTIFGHLSPEQRSRKEPEEGLMAYLGSIFMRSIGIASGREREYQIYMNSVSPLQIPVDRFR